MILSPRSLAENQEYVDAILDTLETGEFYTGKVLGDVDKDFLLEQAGNRWSQSMFDEEFGAFVLSHFGYEIDENFRRYDHEFPMSDHDRDIYALYAQIGEVIVDKLLNQRKGVDSGVNTAV